MEYTLVRSARRTLGVEIDAEARIVVRAPKRMPQWEIDRFLAEKRDWILGAVAKQSAKRDRRPVLTEAEAEALRTRAKEVLPAKLAFWAARMGLETPKMTVTSARTRYGSCSGRNTVSFSKYLMANEDAAVDYVVVHELAHIRHKDHSAAFYAEVASVLPDWKARKALLFMPRVEE
ncbi:MAG: SprT family zinc-dependent metalloprotease [Clostridia bacterium]|nr:SprT family zinc-dependent metalloprotease [Clostridia bacterium]